MTCMKFNLQICGFLGDDRVNIVNLRTLPCVHLFLEPPVISPLSVAVSYNEGSQVSISCLATGTPNPDVTWIRNGQVKSTGKNSAVLTFSSINRTDDGQYTCKANNSAGSKQEQIVLLVHCKLNNIPVIIFY